MERPTMKENLKDYTLEEAHKLYTECPELYRHIVKLDEYIDDLEDKLNNLFIDDVSKCNELLVCDCKNTCDELTDVGKKVFKCKGLPLEQTNWG
jgi:hypothetical protein